MEEVLLKFKKLFKSKDYVSLLEHLQKYRASSEKDIIIYILPNTEDRRVYMKNEGDKLVETKFKAPKWIAVNVMKILKEREKEHKMRRLDHEKDHNVRDLKREVVGMKKDMKSIRKDINILCEMVKMIK